MSFHPSQCFLCVAVSAKHGDASCSACCSQLSARTTVFRKDSMLCMQSVQAAAVVPQGQGAGRGPAAQRRGCRARGRQGRAGQRRGSAASRSGPNAALSSQAQGCDHATVGAPRARPATYGAPCTRGALTCKPAQPGARMRPTAVALAWRPGRLLWQAPAAEQGSVPGGRPAGRAGAGCLAWQPGFAIGAEVQHVSWLCAPVASQWQRRVAAAQRRERA